MRRRKFVAVLAQATAAIATGVRLSGGELPAATPALLPGTYDDYLPDDFFVGDIIVLGDGQRRTITEYDGATGRITVDVAFVQKNWITAPGEESTYLIVPGRPCPTGGVET